MVEIFLDLEPKDKITYIGILVTALLGIGTLTFSILNNQRNIYSSTILKERLDSLSLLKNHIANFNSLVSLSAITKNPKINSQEILKLGHLIKFQLNFKKGEEKNIIDRVSYIMHLIILLNDEKDVNQIREYCLKYDLEFFRMLNFDDYNQQKLINLFYTKMLESLNEVEPLFRNHIKHEWEKIKQL